MAQFKVTNPLAKPVRSMVLDSSDINFDRLVLEACGGGMSEQSTSKAMAARQELLELPNGGKLTLKCGSIQLEFERMIKVKPIN